MKDKEKLKNLIESVIFCTWDCENLDVDPPVTEKGMTLEETVKVKLPQFEKFIDSLLSSQLKEVRKKLRVEHFECEVKRNRDRWCECGAMQENARIDDLLAELSKPTAGSKR